MKVLVLFYSAYGHIRALAEAVAAGAREAGAEVALKRVPETLSPELVAQLGIREHQDIPIASVEELAEYDGIVIGAPTYFGNMASQMRAFIDGTGALWAKGALIGKVGSAFTSTAAQHGGQETTILSCQISLLHHGMVVVGLPYSFQGQLGVEEVKGGTPYGATTISGDDGSRPVSQVELEAARFQGAHVARIAGKLAN